MSIFAYVGLFCNPFLLSKETTFNVVKETNLNKEVVKKVA